MVNITEKRQKILKTCKDQGFFLLDDGLEYYEHKESVSRAVSELVENGLMEEKEAPDISTKEKVWDITKRGKIFTE